MKTTALLILAVLLLSGCSESEWVYDYGEVTDKIMKYSGNFLNSSTTWITVINTDKNGPWRTVDTDVYDTFGIGDRVYVKYKSDGWGTRIVVFSTGPDGEKVE